MKALGLVLLVVGVLALIYGGVSWTREKKIIDAGPIEVSADQRESVIVPPLAGLALVVAGVVLVMKK